MTKTTRSTRGQGHTHATFSYLRRFRWRLLSRSTSYM